MKTKRLKTGGRKIGTPNRTTAEFKELFTNFVDAKFESVVSSFDTLEAKDKVKFFLDFCKFVIPTCKEIELQTDVNISRPQIIVNNQEVADSLQKMINGE